MMERPILFSGPMVRAILDGRKSHTRRVVKPQPDAGVGLVWARSISGEWGPFTMYHYREERTGWIPRDDLSSLRCPYGQPGDRLWVRESFSGPHEWATIPPSGWGWDHSDVPIWYWADGNPEPGDWTRPKPSIHMPRWASRITLELTDVRVQRVQDISEEDAIAEGIRELPLQERKPGAWLCADPFGNPSLHYRTPRAAFSVLWDSINEKRGFGWNANPWVWALTFKRVEE